MIPFDQELRLLHCLAINVLVLVSAWRLVRRAGGQDRVQCMLDTGLAWFLVQYLSVGLPGLAGILSVWTMSATAIVLSAVMWLPFRKKSVAALTADLNDAVPFACLLFIAGYAAALIYQQRYMPVTSIDALAYHLPAAVDWLQTGKIGLHEIWFYNPANAYSPLGGSVLAAWWIAPIGSDVLVRFMQMPAMVLLAIGIMQVGRNLGSSVSVASLIATMVVLSRPIISEAIFPKDDLFLSAFLMAAIAGLGRSNLLDSLAPWRVGTAVGLALATKYTALLSLPMLLLAIDAPIRAKWRLRTWGIAMVCVIALAAPWYLRNAIQMGNPLFPVTNVLFPGLFRMVASEQLRTVQGVWHVLTGAYHSLPVPIMLMALAAWIVAAIIGWPRLRADPLFRLCVLGPILGIAIFVMVSPYPEIRFIYPSLILIACLGGTAMGDLERAMSPGAGSRLATTVVGVVLGAMVVFISGTAFYGDLGWDFTAVGMLVSGLGTCVWLVMRGLNVSPQARIGFLAFLGLAGGLYAYVYWRSYVRDFSESVYVAWRGEYGSITDGWQFVREKLPSDSVVAYANTYLTHPLYRFGLDRKVVYAPLSEKLRKYEDLPSFQETATDLNMRRLVETVTIADADIEAWIGHLNERRATHLLVVKPDPQSAFISVWPPELDFIAQRPDLFKRIFDDPLVTVFSIEKSASAN